MLCWREVAFSDYQIIHGLPPPPLLLECWYFRYETAMSVSASEVQTWEILGRYSVSEDATCMGLA